MNQSPHISPLKQNVSPTYGLDFSNFESLDLNFTCSKDESSLTFQLEAQNRQSITVKPTIDNQSPQTKHHSIFDKYKTPPTAASSSKLITVIDDPENDIMKAFDQIFSIGTPKKIQINESEKQDHSTIKNFSKKLELQFNSTNNKIKPQFEEQVSNNNKTIEKNKDLLKIQTSNSLIEPSQNLRISEFFKTPLEINRDGEVKNISKIQSLNLSQISNRQSAISQRYDSIALAQLLVEEIFSERDTQKRLVKNTNEEPKEYGQPNLLNNINNNNSQIPINCAIKANKKIPIKEDQNKFSQFQLFLQNRGTSNSQLSGIHFNTVECIEYQEPSFDNQVITTTQRKPEQVSQEHRVPIFMREVVKQNSILPNFQNSQIKQNPSTQNTNLQKLVQSFLKALQFLTNTMQIIKNKTKHKQQIIEQFYGGITLTKFKTCNWEQCCNIEQMEELRLRQNLLVKEWNQNMVDKTLQNYKKITQSYRGVVLNLRDGRGQTKYWEMRKKLWDIQKNMIIITSDIQSHILSLGFPPHFLQFKQILQDNQIIFTQPEVRARRIMVEKIKRLRTIGDSLSLSEVGTLVLSKLLNQIKFNSTNL